MVFSSPIFLFIFLPIVFVLHSLIRSTKARNLLLAFASLLFYAFGQLYYVPLFIGSIAINYAAGVLLQRSRHRKGLLAIAVILNLGLLGAFKCTDFVISNLNAAAGTSIPLSGIVLPIGISFFTFQAMSYVIDVYREPGSGTKNFMKLFLYISFFPQLIAGPIVKYHDISKQIDSREVTVANAEQGLKRFCIGVAKKVLISNVVGTIADKVFVSQLASCGAGMDWRIAWLGAVCYSLQIYYDFSGYSDMAIGMGKMFGFSFQENFSHPYAATSIQNFWRRWHISLSSWFKEYLYIPLGGNKKSKLRTAMNKLIVFFCTGIWHGANWTFLFWGLGHGLLSSLEGNGVIPTKKLNKTRAGRIFCRIYTLMAVMLLFVVFRADSIRDGFQLIAAMFTGHVTADASYTLFRLLPPASILVIVLAVLFAGEWKSLASLGDKVPYRWLGLKDSTAMNKAGMFVAILLYALSILSLSRGGFNPFIYFQF